MDPDFAYTLGTVIAGGRIGENRVNIRLPFKRWGKTISDPTRAADILKSIVRYIHPKLKQLYELDAYPQIEPEWQIICEGNLTKLEKDLLKYNIKPQGVLREHASIGKLVSQMDALCKRDFVAALADVIGSVEPSHRRFDMKHTIVSFEILGENFNLVMELCHLLRDLGCPADQILWEHPNMHCGYDPWDDEWINKGNKLRVLTWDYVLRASFAFGSKLVAAETNIEIERQIEGRRRSPHVRNEFCPNRRYQFKGEKTVHRDEFHERLDPRVHGHFIHYTHICAAMGCPYAPKKQILRKIKQVKAGHLVNAFVIYKFGNLNEIMGIVRTEPIMKNRKYATKKIPASTVASLNDNTLFFKWATDVGYRVGLIKDGLNQIVKANLGITRRKRLKGLSNRTETLRLIIRKHTNLLDKITFKIPELPTPLIMTDGNWAVLIGPENPLLYKKLIQKADLASKGLIFRPIKEADLCPEVTLA